MIEGQPMQSDDRRARPHAPGGEPFERRISAQDQCSDVLVFIRPTVYSACTLEVRAPAIDTDALAAAPRARVVIRDSRQRVEVEPGFLVRSPAASGRVALHPPRSHRPRRCRRSPRSPRVRHRPRAVRDETARSEPPNRELGRRAGRRPRARVRKSRVGSADSSRRETGDVGVCSDRRESSLERGFRGRR